MKFPALYKKSSTGALQVWVISTEDNVIVTTWGQDGGVMQTTTDAIKNGKNKGKKNETTPEQQAESEATSQWEKKLKRGYVKTKEEAQAGKKDKIITGGRDVMLAHRFDQHGHKLNYPCYIQPKLDGHRCIAVVEDGEVTLWTRTRKPITSMGHIIKAIESLELPDGIALDGELYNHDYRDKFEKLTSFIRDTEAKPGVDVVQYHIYDVLVDDLMVDDESKYEERWQFIWELFDCRGADEPLVKVETRPVVDEDELLIWFNEYLKQGYEGAIARNAAGMYVGKRSYDLLKIKEFQDGEFEVVGVEQGKGKLAGHAIFVCKADNGAEFRAKMVGSTDELKKYWYDPGLAVGRNLTVKYFGLTNKNGVPRFPVALRFRDDD